MNKETYCLAAFIAAFLIPTDLSSAAPKETERHISADLMQQSGPLDTMFKFCVGAGRANEGLRADWQRQLTLARSANAASNTSACTVCSPTTWAFIAKTDGNPQYNWQYIDELYDFLQSIGMKPFVELSFMPNALASGPKRFSGGAAT